MSVLFLAVFAAGGARAAGAPRNIDPEASCMTTECHVEMGEFKFPHGPSGMGECQMCHEPDGKKHRFDAISDTPTLCSACHDSVTEEENVHFPASEDCTLCHNPHGSEVPTMLKSKNQSDLCFACHDEEIMAGQYKHGPAAVGACSMCHNPHSSPFEKMLRVQGTDLCAECHTDFIKTMAEGTYLHGPVAQDCALCHNPHSGPKPKMLPATTHELCGKCHEEVIRIATESTVRHGPVEDVNGCLNCHLPHAAETAPQLKEPQLDLCLGCHNKPLDSGEGRLLTNMKALLDENEDWHGPIQEGECSGCHEIHGGENFRFVMEAYPAEFYSPYDPANYELCFTCHDPAMVRNEYTRTLTGFRDGDRNLHFLHVNKEERGRTCRACHEVHASQKPRHIRESVPYGKWDLPLNYEKSELGGTCSPGCHASQTYDRTIRVSGP